VKKLFDEVAPKYGERNGGYTQDCKNRFSSGRCGTYGDH